MQAAAAAGDKALQDARARALAAETAQAAAAPRSQAPAPAEANDNKAEATPEPAGAPSPHEPRSILKPASRLGNILGYFGPAGVRQPARTSAAKACGRGKGRSRPTVANATPAAPEPAAPPGDDNGS